MHEFPLRVRWQGSTAGEYSTAGEASAASKDHPIATSSAPAYAGDPARWNPEELLGAALATCHQLTFLALARKAKLDIRSYADEVTVTLDAVDGVTQVTRIRLSPTLEVAGGGSPEKVRELFEKAHKYCFVARSIRSEVVMEPRVVPV